MSKENSKLIIVCGLPGSDKTTLAKRLESQLSATRFCTDEKMQKSGISLFSGKHRARIEREMWSFGRQLLKDGRTIIIEFGSWGRSERVELLEGAKELGAQVELYILDPPIDELRSRLSKRNAEGDEALLTRGELEKANENFQRPQPNELNLYDKHHIVTRR